MQFDNSHIENYFNDKKNENINDNDFNINPKILEEKSTNYYEGKNIQIKRGTSLRIPNPSEDKQYRNRRAKSISFVDVSRISNSEEIYYEKAKNNNISDSSYIRNYQMVSSNNKMVDGSVRHHRTHSNTSGTTTLARKRSFRKPKVLINSKEHIRRLKKMKSISALSFKQETEKNKTVKRRYSIHSPPSPRIYTYDDYDDYDYFYGSRIEDYCSNLPPNTLYDELKKVHENELLETVKQFESDNESFEVRDEETIFYDSDNSLFSDEKEEDRNHSSLIKLILKYLDNSINGKRSRYIDRDMKENIYDYSYISENSQYMDEESELYKQEEMLESIFDDVVKGFYGYQTKFLTTILRLFSFLLYNGGKMELGHHLLKYILIDKLGINISSSSEDSYTQNINTIQHFENNEIGFITAYELKEAKKHEIRRKKGYQSIKKFWMIFHTIFIISFMYIFIMFNPPKIVTHLPNNANINLINTYYKINLLHQYSKLENVFWLPSTPVTWLIPDNNQQEIYNQCFIDSFSGNKVINYISIKKDANRLEKPIKFKILIKQMIPWKTLVVFECILISLQLGFQYLIMDEIIPLFKPKLYTTVHVLNKILNFFVQFKDIWKLLYNDICLYIFILGIYYAGNKILISS